jgi:hypothetical protein
VVSRLLEGEAVLVHPVNGKVQVLNPVGARVWDLADGQRKLVDIIQIITTEYDAETPRVQADVVTFCEDLEQRGVLEFDS